MTRAKTKVTCGYLFEYVEESSPGLYFVMDFQGKLLLEIADLQSILEKAGERKLELRSPTKEVLENVLRRFIGGIFAVDVETGERLGGSLWRI